MNEKYYIYLYKTRSDKEIISNFIDDLNKQEKLKVRNAIRLLKNYGLYLLTTPWIKKITSKPAIFELRVSGLNQIRLLFLKYDRSTFIMIHIFIKKTQKIPQKDLKLAIRRSKEFI